MSGKEIIDLTSDDAGDRQRRNIHVRPQVSETALTSAYPVRSGNDSLMNCNDVQHCSPPNSGFIPTASVPASVRQPGRSLPIYGTDCLRHRVFNRQHSLNLAIQESTGAFSRHTSNPPFSTAPSGIQNAPSSDQSNTVPTWSFGLLGRPKIGVGTGTAGHRTHDANEARANGISVNQQSLVLVNTNEMSGDIDSDEGIDGVEDSCEIIDITGDDPIVASQVVDEHALPDPIKFKNANSHVTCAPNKTIEFVNDTYMKIKSVVKAVDGSIFLVGKLLVRQNCFGQRAPKRPNELVWTVENATSDGNTRILFREHDIVRNRHLIMTNHHYPVMSRKDHPDACQDIRQDIHFGPLFCRWKRIKTEHEKREGVIVAESWIALSAQEADDKATVGEQHKRLHWRGRTTTLGGSHVTMVPFHNLSANVTSQACYMREQAKYTFCDAFCGAGGTSYGARKAGLAIQLAFDKDSKAADTYQLNFPEAKCHKLDVHSFIVMARDREIRVDVLHLSPPCQFFSPAHTIEGRNDEANTAAFLCILELVKAIRPRIVTLEETEGLRNRHEPWLCMMIHTFIDLGYSISWKIVDCTHYGVPQKRKRLVVIAAGPGEVVPDFPQPTHGPGLKPLTTIRSELSKIPPNAPNDERYRWYEQPKLPYSFDSQAATLTTRGGERNYYPDGTREYTIRERAYLQTFDDQFKFVDAGITDLKRQIGNAVPPELARLLFKSVHKSLKKADGV